jgi:hypothetical protein
MATKDVLKSLRDLLTTSRASATAAVDAADALLAELVQAHVVAHHDRLSRIANAALVENALRYAVPPADVSGLARLLEQAPHRFENLAPRLGEKEERARPLPVGCAADRARVLRHLHRRSH